MRHQSRAPLRLLVVTDGASIPNWLRKCLAAVTQSGAATVVVASYAARPGVRALQTLRRLLFSLYEHLDRLLVRRGPDALAGIDPHAALPNCHVVDLRTSLARVLAGGRLDVVLDPFSLLADGGPGGAGGAGGALADCSTYGVWSVAFGDAGDPRTQGTPVFWEIVEGRPSTSTRLCIRWKGSATQRVLYSSVAATYRHSVSRARNHIYWKLSAALTRTIQGLWEDPAGFRERLRAAASAEGTTKPPGPPGNLAMLGAMTRLARRYAAGRWTHALYRDQWALAYQRGARERPAIDAFRTLLPPTDRYWADPFPIRMGKDYYIFHEELLFATRKGTIVLSVVDDAGQIAGPIPILEKDYHVSYPFVFQWDGDFFMIPQTDSHRVELYRCVNFPARWELERVLLPGVTASDPTPAFLGGRWWLFANVPAYGATWVHDELHLFHADSPLGPWTPHRNNPVKSDVRSARPAGRIFERDGQYYRPAQDCSRRYGYAVSINRIVRLDPDVYEEVEVDRISPHRDSRLAGVHTFNVADDMTVIDCLIRRRKLWARPWRGPLHLGRVARHYPPPAVRRSAKAT